MYYYYYTIWMVLPHISWQRMHEFNAGTAEYYTSRTNLSSMELY